MIFIYILLTVIAVGVLLITPIGQLLLKWSGITAVGGLILCGALILIVAFWEPIVELLGTTINGIAALAILLAVWIGVFVVAPGQINKLFKNPEHKKAFWVLFFVAIVALYAYRMVSYSNGNI